MTIKNLDPFMRIDLRDQATRTTPVYSDFNFGYTVVGDLLVPDVFLMDLAVHLGSRHLEYGMVYSPSELCGREFFNALTNEERTVLGPSILLLLSDGSVKMNFADKELVNYVGPLSPGPGYGRYLTMGKHLPKALFEFMKANVGKITFEHGTRVSARQAFGEEFWSTLGEEERNLLKNCVLSNRAADHIGLHVED